MCRANPGQSGKYWVKQNKVKSERKGEVGGAGLSLCRAVAAAAAVVVLGGGGEVSGRCWGGGRFQKTERPLLTRGTPESL